MNAFLKLALRFLRRSKPRGWTMHRAGTARVAVPTEHGWRYVEMPVVCHVSPAGKCFPVICSDRTGKNSYLSLFRVARN